LPVLSLPLACALVTSCMLTDRGTRECYVITITITITTTAAATTATANPCTCPCDPLPQPDVRPPPTSSSNFIAYVVHDKLESSS
jgi:hypothetical protein